MKDDLIRRDFVLEEIKHNFDNVCGDRVSLIAEAYRLAHQHVSKLVEIIPAVDAAEVVRCRECKYYKESSLFPGTLFCYVLKFAGNGWGINTMPDDFCSYAERREEGDGDD